MWRSVRHTPQVWTRTRTSPGPGCGSGTPAARSGCPGRSSTIARMASGPLAEQRRDLPDRPGQIVVLRGEDPGHAVPKELLAVTVGDDPPDHDRDRRRVHARGPQ